MQTTTNQRTADALLAAGGAAPPALSPSEILAGRRIYLIGGTGFLGKLFLGMLLHNFPGIGRIYVMVRPGSGTDAETRFYADVAGSPVFDPLRARYGGALDGLLRDKVRVTGGDITRDNLGLSEQEAQAVADDIDVVVNSSGKVTFNPALDQSLRTNVTGTKNVIAFAKRMKRPCLVHMSTCFVAGNRSGTIWEDAEVRGYFPRQEELEGASFSAEQEIADCAKLAERVREEADEAVLAAELRLAARRRLREEGRDPDNDRFARLAQARERKNWIRQRMTDLGVQRAQRWGWPNIYCYTKSLAEQLVAAEEGIVRTIVRPSVVESSVSFPFAGWNEGFTTSAPIVFLALKGQNIIPCSDKLILDMIPVDHVAAGLTLITAQACVGRPELVYQLSSGDENPLRMKRMVTLLGLHKRQHFQDKAEGNRVVNEALARMETRTASYEEFERSSVPLFRRMARRTGSLLERARPRWGGSLLKRFGANRLEPARGQSLFAILFNQFKSPLVLLLFAAAGIAFAVGEGLEGGAILVVVVLNAALGFFTEWKAEKTLTALQKQTVRKARAVRGGVERELPAAELVPGDLIVLEAGARVPADGRIIETVRLQIEEAALTGESKAVTKSTDPIADVEAPLADRINLAFMGTTIINGRGQLLVTGTGVATEMGKIGVLIDEARSNDTPLEKKLARLGRLLLVIVLALCAVIVFAGWLRGHGFVYVLEVGISLAIAAVPEGLPAVATMTLAIGMQRMARMGALIRRLPAVETLGSTTVICTDKTGTLTRNEMMVSALVLDGRRIDVTGAGYSPFGGFEEDGQPVEPRADAHLTLALRIGLLCNDAKVAHADGKDAVLGDPTEAALIVAAEKAGLKEDALEAEFPRISEQPFDSATKRMATVHRMPQGRMIMFVKGSPSTLLAASSSQVRESGVTPLTSDDRARWGERNQDLAGAALRVLAVAYRDLPDGQSENDADATKHLVFVGLVGMTNPLRAEAKTAIATCREAGIRSVMITGDQQVTAAEIARQLGIDRGLDGEPLRSVHARELANLDATGWQETVKGAAVFARVSPKHKLQIVEALQAQGQIVAMTGDGVNDAPALKKADIGVAMGIKGTEVAKETADMVIVDDNFATIVSAVEQGRIIFANILRFVRYLFSCNLSELLTVFIALMVGWPLPLGALQILWLNMITDIFPALALALEPSVPGMMSRPPHDPKTPLLPARLLVMIGWQGLLLAAVTLLAFFLGMRMHGAEGEGLKHAITVAFMTLAFVQVIHVFSSRSETRSALDARLFKNGWLWGAVALCVLLQVAAVYVPFLRVILHTVPLGAKDWGVVAGCSLFPLVVVEVVKSIQRRFARASVDPDLPVMDA